jgi:hypothetical protein
MKIDKLFETNKLANLENITRQLSLKECKNILPVTKEERLVYVTCTNQTRSFFAKQKGEKEKKFHVISFQ